MSQGIDGGTRKSVSYSCNSINPSASSYLPVINF
jgi:hypothetical protein